MSKNLNIGLRFQNIIFTILVMIVIGLLAWLGKTYHTEFDFTHNQQNSLHASTQKLLRKLDKPLQLIAYIPDDATVHQALKKRVTKYQKYKKDISLEIINPDLNPDKAKADGIQFSGQLLIRLGDKSEIISSVDEQTVINVLQRLSRDKPRLAVFLEGHNERQPFDENSNGISKLAKVLQTQGFNIQPHNLIRTQSIPSDATFIVIAAPQKAYLEAEVKIITDYIKQGGNLLWMHEPGEMFGLDNLEQQLGIVINEGTMLEANQALQDMLGIKHPAAIAIIDYGESELTKDLTAHTIFPFATAIARDEETEQAEQDEKWKYQPLLTTLPTSWLESGEIQGDVKFDDEADKPGPLDIAMTLTRPNSINEKAPDQRIVVMGDSNFMLNNFIGQGSNIELATNIFNWLGADDELLSITRVSAPDTTLDMPNWALYGMSLFFLLVLPIGLLLIGTVRWMRRRKR
ncbi:MAG: GldG family protein [Cocleimonas sp.]|nr:GldG family protein [Cocleimonas sp.]